MHFKNFWFVKVSKMHDHVNMYDCHCWIWCELYIKITAICSSFCIKVLLVCYNLASILFFVKLNFFFNWAWINLYALHFQLKEETLFQLGFLGLFFFLKLRYPVCCFKRNSYWCPNDWDAIVLLALYTRLHAKLSISILTLSKLCLVTSH